MTSPTFGSYKTSVRPTCGFINPPPPPPSGVYPHRVHQEGLNNPRGFLTSILHCLTTQLERKKQDKILSINSFSWVVTLYHTWVTHVIEACARGLSSLPEITMFGTFTSSSLGPREACYQWQIIHSWLRPAYEFLSYRAVVNRLFTRKTLNPRRTIDRHTNYHQSGDLSTDTIRHSPDQVSCTLTCTARFATLKPVQLKQRLLIFTVRNTLLQGQVNVLTIKFCSALPQVHNKWMQHITCTIEWVDNECLKIKTTECFSGQATHTWNVWLSLYFPYPITLGDNLDKALISF